MASVQKKLAAKVLKVGATRVWVNPEKMKDVAKAITKWDIRKLIKKGDIKAIPERIHAVSVRRKRRRGPGSKEGKKNALVAKKRKWINTVRPQRRMLTELKTTGQIDKITYRKLYNLVKGGMFRSRSHLRLYMEQNSLLLKK